MTNNEIIATITNPSKKESYIRDMETIDIWQRDSIYHELTFIESMKEASMNAMISRDSQIGTINRIKRLFDNGRVKKVVFKYNHKKIVNFCIANNIPYVMELV